MTDQPKPRRRWSQFSLRTLFVVVTVFCVWMGITAQRARNQRQAVEAILEAGGEIEFEHNSGWYSTSSPPPGPDWLRRLVGDDYFFSVIFVRFSGEEFNNANLVAVGQLTDVRALHLVQTKITDAGLEHLKRLTKLERLFLVGTPITDAGLETLGKLPNLETLYLGGREITDEGVKRLQQVLPKCQIFYPGAIKSN